MDARAKIQNSLLRLSNMYFVAERYAVTSNPTKSLKKIGQKATGSSLILQQISTADQLLTRIFSSRESAIEV